LNVVIETYATDRNIDPFDFLLPESLIAQHPTSQRSDSRLLHVGAHLSELKFSELGDLLNAGDLLICNDSKVIPARIAAHKLTGGRVEVLIERVVDDRHLEVQLGARRRIRIGDALIVEDR